MDRDVNNSLGTLLGRTQWTKILIPVVVFLVVAGVVSALVLTGTIQGDAVRSSSESLPTTIPTIKIMP